MALAWPFKDPEEVLDYQVDWSLRLGVSDSIQSSTWDVPVGITKDSDSFTPNHTIIWLSGGTEGETYVLTNHIETLGLRSMDQSIKLKVKTK